MFRQNESVPEKDCQGLLRYRMEVKKRHAFCILSYITSRNHLQSFITPGRFFSPLPQSIILASGFIHAQCIVLTKEHSQGTGPMSSSPCRLDTAYTKDPQKLATPFPFHAEDIVMGRNTDSTTMIHMAPLKTSVCFI